MVLNSETCRPGTAGEADVRGEEGDGVVAPVLGQPGVREVGSAGRLLYRHELDGGDAELEEMIDDRLGGQPEEGAEVLGGTAGCRAVMPFTWHS